MSINKFNYLVEKDLFEHHYQPIYNLKNQNRVGYEVLFRSTLFENPEIVFRTAKKVNRLYELDMKSIKNALFSYSKLGVNINNEKLFINVFPSTISNPNFLKTINKIILEVQLKKSQIVFEINEDEIIPDIPFLKENLSVLRKQGYFIAMDDVGKGAASLRALIELEPHCVKMDRYFAYNLAVSEQKQEMIRSVLTYCQNTGAYFILEGIENTEDLETAKTLGVSFGQGFLLGKPSPL